LKDRFVIVLGFPVSKAPVASVVSLPEHALDMFKSAEQCVGVSKWSNVDRFLSAPPGSLCCTLDDSDGFVDVFIVAAIDA
jgi:hypothetical protein